MKRGFKSNILVVCLDQKFGVEVAKAFADTVSMLFADCKDLIEYDLFDSKQVLSQCGQEYYDMREKQVVKHVCQYENALIFSSYDLFVHNREEFLKNSTLFYIRLPQKALPESETISRLAYEDRDENLSKVSDVIVNIKRANTKLAMKEIFKMLGGEL